MACGNGSAPSSAWRPGWLHGSPLIIAAGRKPLCLLSSQSTCPQQRSQSPPDEHRTFWSFQEKGSPGVWSTILSKCPPKDCLRECPTANTCPDFPGIQTLSRSNFRGLNLNIFPPSNSSLFLFFFPVKKLSRVEFDMFAFIRLLRPEEDGSLGSEFW